MGLGSLAAQHHSRKRVVFVVYGKKLTRSLPPSFIFYQHNAQNGQKTSGDSRQCPKRGIELYVLTNSRKDSHGVEVVIITRQACS